MKKKTAQFLKGNWQSLTAWSAGIVILAGLLLFRLGSFVRGDNNFETRDGLGITGLDAVLQDITFAPQKIASLAALKIDEPNVTLTRLLSVAIVAISVIALFLLLRKWHTTRVALITSVLFAVSSYTLHLGRFSNTDALLYALVPLVLLFGTWLKAKRTVSRLPLALLAASVLVYIPGVLLLYVGLFIAFKKRLLLAWKFISDKFRLVSIGGATIVLLPLLYSLATQPAQLTRYLGIDRLTEEGIRSVFDTLIQLPNVVAWNGPQESAYRWLSGSPLLDSASLLLVVIGAYAYLRGPHPLRARLLAGMLIFTVVMYSLSSVVTAALILPLLYIVIANGIAFLLQSWFTVFPRNPAARSVALVIIVILSSFIASYHLQRYFVAWPNATATEQALSPENTQQ